MVDAYQLALTHFDSYNPAELGPRFYELVKGNSCTIGREHPRVVEAYATREKAIGTVRQIVGADEAMLHPFVVVYDGTPIGVVMLRQTPLKWGIGPFRREVLSGPHIAMWSAHPIDRQGAPYPLTRHLMPLILDKVSELGMSGIPWTLVLPERVGIRDSLERANMRLLGRPRRYGIGDGVSERRVLYVANQ